MPRLPAFLACLLLLGAPAAPVHARAACAASAADGSAVAEAIDLVNAERRQRGLSAVRPSAALGRAAARQACDLAATRRLSHTGSDGSSMAQRVKGAGYRMRFANENIGMGFRSPESAVAWWMNSPGHRANILEPRVREIGVAVSRSDKLYWAMVLGEPKK